MSLGMVLSELYERSRSVIERGSAVGLKLLKLFELRLRCVSCGNGGRDRVIMSFPDRSKCLILRRILIFGSMSLTLVMAKLSIARACLGWSFRRTSKVLHDAWSFSPSSSLHWQCSGQGTREAAHVAPNSTTSAHSGFHMLAAYLQEENTKTGQITTDKQFRDR